MYCINNSTYGPGFHPKITRKVNTYSFLKAQKHKSLHRTINKKQKKIDWVELYMKYSRDPSSPTDRIQFSYVPTHPQIGYCTIVN